MRRVLVLLLLLAAAYAAKVPVAALHLVPGVLWPAPTYRVLGPECEETVAALPVKLAEAQCYEMVVANPDDAATYLYFVARGLAERYRLLEEKMLDERTLAQVWEGEGKKLYLWIRFDKNRFFIVAGYLE